MKIVNFQTVTKAFEDPVKRKNVSDGIKRTWQREDCPYKTNEYKEKHSKGLKRAWIDPNNSLGSAEHKERISISSKETWITNEYLNSKEHRESIGKQSKERWEDEEYRERTSLNIRLGTQKSWHKNENRRKGVSTRSKKWWKSLSEGERNRLLKKFRLGAIRRMEARYGQVSPNYNPAACKIIDDYGEQYGYNFQHAENGGEFRIDKLGYWVDGYDEEKNVAIEVDEPFHFDSNGNLSERDVSRQKEIMEELGCEFIRLKLIEQ